MSGNTEGAGPALAAHSDSGEAISQALQQATDFVRGQPLASMGIFILPASSSVTC
jgi:hypothetical protein